MDSKYGFQDLISVIDDAEHNRNLNESTDEDCGCDDEVDENKDADDRVKEVLDEESDDEVDENADADKRIKEVLDEEGEDDLESLEADKETETEQPFWDNFEKDNDFEISENNGMYCVTGTTTEFHYGSHVDYDIAAQHIDSLREYQR